MTTATTQLKVGVFLLCAVVAVVAVALGLGLHMREPVIRYHTYVDESVSGLDLGAVVDYRGVHVGSVGAIAVAPDHSRIDVTLEIAEGEAARLGLAERAPRLRARLESTGITGVKYVDVEPVGEDAPPPELAFEPARNYIPARPSLLGSLASQAERVGRNVPILVDHATIVIDKVGRLIDELRDQHVPARIRVLAEHLDAAVVDVRHLLRRIDNADIAEKVGSTLANVDAVAARARDVLANVDGGGELEQTVRDIGDAARAFTDLVQEIEREPDVLLKGRARSKGL